MRKLIRHIIPEEKKDIFVTGVLNLVGLFFVLNCFVLVLIIFILSPSVELQQAVFSLGELIPLPKLSFPLCWPRGTTVAGGKHSCDSEHPSVVHASFHQTAWAVLCCGPVLIFDWCSEFQVSHFHAAIGLKHRQVAPWKCKDSLDFCPPYPQRAQSYKYVCLLCSCMYHLGFSTLQPAPF